MTDYDRLRTDARALKKAYRAGEPEAARRLRAYVDSDAPKHADFLHVIAREAGFQSWPKLKLGLAIRDMSRDERAERLKYALYLGRGWVIEQLLAADPDLPAHNPGLQIAMYDVDAVKAALTQPGFVNTRIGIRTPLLHLAFSRYHKIAPDRQAAMLEIADLLLAAGADPNDGYPWQPGEDHHLSALYGALGHADNLPLARKLLEAGATPNDAESLYHATELGHRDGLRLLLEYGAETRDTNALLRAIDFDDAEAVGLLLTHGADPNEQSADHPSGEPVPKIPALHHAARRWAGAEVARLILDHGGDATLVWDGHTAYALARIFGNGAVADLLAARGHKTTLKRTEQILADCADGKAPAGKLAPSELGREDRALLTQVILRPERLAHAKALVAAGIDPNWTDDMNLTPLHAAAWHGLPEQTGWLLGLAPDLEYENAYGGNAMGTLIHGAENAPRADTSDYIATARLLLEAGAPLHPSDARDCGDPDLAAFLDGWPE